MKKVFKYVLLILFFSLTILFFNQSFVEARTIRTIETIEELKEAFEEKATIEGNTIKLIDNVTLNDRLLDIEISEITIDFNGKTIECTEEGAIYVCNKITFKDSSTTNRVNWGGIIFSSRYESIQVKEGAELIINNGKFVDDGTDTFGMLLVKGKLTIDDAIFSTTRTESGNAYNNYMIKLQENSEVVINNGDFSHCATIIDVGANNPYKNNSKLTINGGNFKSIGEIPGTISISSLYPYVDENNNREIITPTIVLDNCNIENKYIAIQFHGGSTEEEYRNADTKIITILGGTYKCSEKGIAVFDISTNLSPFTYFNPKDFVLQGGTFESLSVGARSFSTRRTKKTVNIQQFVTVC